MRWRGAKRGFTPCSRSSSSWLVGRACRQGATLPEAFGERAAYPELEAAGARRILNDYFFFSAPQLKRIPLGGLLRKDHASSHTTLPDASADQRARGGRSGR